MWDLSAKPFFYSNGKPKPFSLSLSAMSSNPKHRYRIIEVWANNLHHEMDIIRAIIDKYPFVAMDTEYPGITVKPSGSFTSYLHYNYSTLKANVDALKIIQLGLTFSDQFGNLPLNENGEQCVWQFNFREFTLSRDLFSPESIMLLTRSGIDFDENNFHGVDSKTFAELLMSSGVVMNENAQWITFHSGYDFGYLIKLLTGDALPSNFNGFYKLIHMFFPRIYDIKYLTRFCDGLHGGLNRLAEILSVQRIGICHQAGSDSLLTLHLFLKIRDFFFQRMPEEYANVLYGYPWKELEH